MLLPAPFLLTITLIAYLQSASTYETCIGNYCPPAMGRPKTNLIKNIIEPAPIFLGRDDSSGCICREYPKIYVVCFGRSYCAKMPVNINITTPLLRITTTHIQELKRGDFDGLENLEALQIEGNVNLSTILPGAFDSNLTKLTNLSLSFNPNLRWLDSGSLEGLVSLRHLFLIKNGIENIYGISQAITPKVLPKLVELSLNENNLSNISENDFAPMLNSTLEELNLVLCRLEILHPNCLTPLKNLEVLRIGENSFSVSTITNVIENSINSGIPLKVLNLYSVGFRKHLPRRLLEAIARSNISNLNLARNQFEVISSNSFPYMPNLHVLDLRDVLALDIANDAFTNLPNLRTLLLSENKLPRIPEGVLLENLTYLDLQDNSGNPLFPSYFSITDGIFSDMHQLIYLNLNFNRINHLFTTSFVGLSKLLVLGLKNATIYHIQNSTFTPLKNLLFLNLENNYFVKNMYPIGMEGDIFKGLENLHVLLLGGCSIKYFSKYGNPFKHLKSLKHLGLEGNLITRISPSQFMPLVHLETIDMSNNLLKPWKNRIFTSNKFLKNIVINKNKLTYISQTMLDEFSNISTVEMQENPFTCDCNTFREFRKWCISNPRNKIMTILDPNAFCVFPEVISNNTVLNYFKNVQNNTLFCSVDHFSTKLVIILPLVLLLLVFVSLVAFVYYYRWHIKYWIFLTRLYLSRKGKIHSKKEKKSFTNYEYDAFVSYSNEDRNYVVKLVTMLENYEPFLKLCVYERDFQIGSIISESVLESVAKSRKTLLIVSDNYAKSQWCRWESQIAEHHRLFFENENGEYVDDTLILVKLGPVSENHLTPTLKYLLKTRIYLQWEVEEKKQRIFWEKLRSTLAPPKPVKIEVQNSHI